MMNNHIIFYAAHETDTDVTFRRLREKTFYARTPEEVCKFFAQSETSRWVTSSSGPLLRILSSVSASRRHRLLVLERTEHLRLEMLRSVFRSVSAYEEPLCFLPNDELTEVLTAPNSSHLVIAVAYDPSMEAIYLLRGNLESLIVPASAFTPSPLGTIPDFTNIKVTDHGQTLQLGDYEASVDALLYEFDREYRRELKRQRLASEGGLGASIRRLRLQRGLRLKDIAGVSPREVARIERGEIHKPQEQTIKLIAKALRVAPEKLEEF